MPLLSGPAQADATTSASHSSPRLTLITVCRNSEATIGDTLRSVASQSCAPYEHLVIDGASTDGTRAVIERERHPTLQLFSEPDSGIYDAMNKGLARASGDVIGFLNADDVFAEPDVLLQYVTAFSDPGIEAAYGDLEYVSNSDPGRVVRRWNSSPFRSGAFRQGWVPPHPTFYVRRATVIRLGGFDTRYRLAADFELMYRYVEVAGIATRYLPGVKVRMRLGGATNRSLTSMVRQNREVMAILRLHGERPGLRFVARRVGARLSQFVTDAR